MPPQPPTTDAEWRKLILTELRETRKEVKEIRDDLHDFQLQVVEDRGENRGRQTTLTAVVSTVVSLIVAVLTTTVHSMWKK